MSVKANKNRHVAWLLLPSARQTRFIIVIAETPPSPQSTKSSARIRVCSVIRWAYTTPARITNALGRSSNHQQALIWTGQANTRSSFRNPSIYPSRSLRDPTLIEITGPPTVAQEPEMRRQEDRQNCRFGLALRACTSAWVQSGKQAYGTSPLRLH